MNDNNEKEKLAVDIFIKYSSKNLRDFKNAINQGKQILMRNIQLDDRFNPKKYVRYYLTFRVINLNDNKPLPKFNLLQQRIERIHNAAISLEILENQLNDLVEVDNLFYYFEIGAIYVIYDGDNPTDIPWFNLN